MSSAWWHPDGMLGWWLFTAGAALVIYAIHRWLAHRDHRRNERVHQGPAFVNPAHDGESAIQIGGTSASELGPAFEVQQTGGFRRLDGRRLP